jgi:hypothetical protein
MSRVEAATAMDRLPWLPDEPTAQPPQRRGMLRIGAALAVVLLVGAGAFWFGARSIKEQAPPSPTGRPTTIVRLPPPRGGLPAQPQVTLPSQPQVTPAPQPQLRPAPVREVRIYIPVERAPARQTAESASADTPPAPASQVAAAPAHAVVQQVRSFAPPPPWNPRVLTGAAGRVVQIGAFGSVHQSKEGWVYMVRAYPAVAHLPAVVRPSRNSRGRAFYRFQVGTTSQAHSEVLCQRMAKIHLSCAVIGLPWKAKVER